MYAKSIILVTLLLSFSEAKEFRFNTNGALCDHFGQCPSTGQLLNKLNSYSNIQVSSFPIQVDRKSIFKIHPKRKVYKSDIDLIELLETNDFSSITPKNSNSCPIQDRNCWGLWDMIEYPQTSNALDFSSECKKHLSQKKCDELTFGK